MAERVDCVVIGAGVIGLAAARELALLGREVIVLEAADQIGTGISSRNSEVIHAGIYYPSGSLKARLCVAGRELLYRYCRDHGVPHRKCGKLIVARDEAQRDQLQALARAGRDNGVPGLTLLNQAETLAREPELRTVAALCSPETGIVDSHALMLSLQGEVEAHDGLVICRTPVTGGRVEPDGIRLKTGGAEPGTLIARSVVNAAGLSAPDVGRVIEGLPAASVPRHYLAKGSYFSLAGKAPFQHLIYPVPEPGGLGIHLTLDLGGQARFGPDVTWVSDIDYQVDKAQAPKFEAAIRQYWQGLPPNALNPAQAGIRPKLSPPGGPPVDFRIDGPQQHNIPGLVNLFGIESPGLTASLAIGRLIAELLYATPA